MTHAIYIALALLVLVMVLISLAVLTPKWQHAEAYESLIFFVPGAFLLVFSISLAVGAALLHGLGWLA